MESLKPQSSAVNGQLWGARADDWASVQEGTATGAYAAVLDQTDVGNQTDFLDVGCGSGLAAQLAWRRGARVSGVDAAEPLLNIARSRVPKGDFRLADIEALPFADASFDVVTGFNAFQYAANPTVALAEARRVTRPSGIIAIVVWGEPEGMQMASIITALGNLLPPPPAGSGGPFALSNEAVLYTLAQSASLSPERMFDVNEPIRYPDIETALRGLNSSGVAAKAIAAAGEHAVSRAHGEALAPYRATDNSYIISSVFRCLLARPSLNLSRTGM